MRFAARRHGSVVGLALFAIIVIAACGSSSWAESGQARNKPLKTVVVFHCEYPPVSFWDRQKDKPSGFFVDVMGDIAGRAGLDVRYICKNGWPEMISAIESGEADVGILLKSAEREKKLNFSVPVDVTHLSFFGRSESSIDVSKVPAGYSVGVIRGSMSYEQMKSRPGVRLVIENSYQEGIFSLLAGEIELFAAEKSMVLKHARETGLEDRIREVGKPFVERERCLAVRKDNVGLVERLNMVLPGFVGSTAYQAIYSRWFSRPAPYWTAKRVVAVSAVLIFLSVCGMAIWRYASISRINTELLQNIDARKKAEETVRADEARLRQITDNMVDMVGQFDERAFFQYASPSYERVLGYRPAELVGTWAPEKIHPDDRDQVISAIDDMLKIGTGSAQYRYRHKDGSYRWIESTGRNVPDRQGNVTGSIMGSRDITDRRLSEEALQKSEQMVRKVLDSVDEGFVVVDRDYRIVSTNRAYCKLVSASCDDVIGKHCYEVSHKANRPCYEVGEECAVKKAFETGEPSTVCHKHGDAGANTLYVETKAFPLKDESGAVTSVIESINNITEKHLLETERLKAQKLEAIGTLAGGIAHDFNNLLQGVFGYISLARLKKDDRQKSLAAIEQAERALEMSVKLTNQLLTFSKGGSPVRRPTSLWPVIENATKFALSGSCSEYRISGDEGLWQAEADEGQIGQVVQNIVLNADQAMPGGGLVEITARNVDIPGENLPLSLQEGKYAEIAIRDSGIGIPEQYLPRIFDPYFTTKEKGSGLGLATSYSIVKNHGGLINVISKPGKGTTFFIYIPAAAEVFERKRTRHTAADAPCRKGKILVMDDEKVIRDVAGELIHALGHEVEFASHGREALEMFREAKRSGKPFDVVILDLTIRGGIGGSETVQMLAEIDPGVKAVVSSGYSDVAVMSGRHDQQFKAFLKKPYNIDDLQEVLQALLGS